MRQTSEQLEHTALLVSLEYCPGAQRAHVRSVVLLGVFKARSPAGHVVHGWQTVSIDAVPPMDAKKPLAQMECASHMTAFVRLLNSVVPSHAVFVAPSHLKPTGHGVQVRSTDDVPANEGYSCAAQVLKAVHVFALVLVLNSLLPSQFVHLRSVVAVGFVNTFVPAEQLRVVVQIRGEVAEPADDWYCVVTSHVGWALHAVSPALSWYCVAP